MSMNLSFHSVAKIEVTKSEKMHSGEGEFSTRSIVIVFDNGWTQQIDVFNHNDTLPLEIN